MTTPTVFISYSHDSAQHREWVRRLATDLRNNGIDASLDEWDLAPGQDITLFMQNGITNSDRVLIICTDNYVSKAEEGEGGVGYERLIVTSEVVGSIDTKKFIPIIRDNSRERPVPSFLGPRMYIDFSSESEYDRKLDELLRELLGVPTNAKPSLGENPFSGQLKDRLSKQRIAGPTGVTESGKSILEDKWFESEQFDAETGISKLGINGRMELRFALHESINKTQVDLLNAVRKSEIQTFGWPIGVLLENQEDYKPVPYDDGIRAEVSIEEDTLSGGSSYDYWAFRSNGDFYLLQSLFEDQRVQSAVFFNTRIVRVTEALLFAAGVYHHLGVPPSVSFSLRVTHQGLAGRTLRSSNPRRQLLPKTTKADESAAEIVTQVGQVRESLPDLVQQLLAPMFILFEFQDFQDGVYVDIVRRFERGESS